MLGRTDACSACAEGPGPGGPSMICQSLRDPSHQVNFADAVRRNLAPDGGLYMPVSLPVFQDVDRLLALPWEVRNPEILRRLLGDEFSPVEVDALAAEAFNFPVPLVKVAERIWILELFHGPTAAFKDFGARFLAQVLNLLRWKTGDSRERIVLTATSGDTGAAVARAFWNMGGFRVVVLYPEGRVSPLQEKQFATLGGNVRALAVQGSFDDCQALAKGCFNDAELSASAGLVSANSINLARLLAQSLYYFEGVAQLRKQEMRDVPVFAVPSGNFGNLCAGLMAQRMGLKVKAFVAATNANRTVPDYLDEGTYLPRPSVPTLSNAMDVGDPSNWARIEHLFSGNLDELRAALRWGSLDDKETRAALWELQSLGYLADPHAAVAYGVLRGKLGLSEPAVFLGTAHPAKFRDVLEGPMGTTIPLPPSLAEVENRPVQRESIPNDLAALKAMLRA